MGLCHGKNLESNRNTLVEQPTSTKEQQPTSRKEQPPTSAKSAKKKKKKNESVAADESENKNSSNSDNILNNNNNNNNNRSSSNNDSANDSVYNSVNDRKDGLLGPSKSPFRIAASPFRYSPFRSPFWPTTPRNNSSANSTPRHFFKRPFPPPSPAKHIQSALHKRHGVVKLPTEGTIHEDPAEEKPLDKNFGYLKIFSSKYELEHEIGRGHFGHTMQAKFKKGDLKGLSVAVKVISKAKMTTAIAIEDVRREVKILKALTGHNNLVQFYDACEDNVNVYIVMELCEGGELLDRILSRGGKYSEEDAKAVVIQILNIVAFCHLQGVVHRDLKPENFLFTTKDENSQLKAIDFGLSDFVRPDERLNDIVGSAYYVAPEVLHRSYNTEADIWSIGVITYILLCGSRPFWARTESGIFRAVLKTEPNYEELPWPSVSLEAKDFVKRLLNKDRHKRMTAAQALAHPWIHGTHKIPLDILVYRLVKSYLCSSNLRKAALKALSKTLCEDDMAYLKAQFMLLQPPKSGRISLENFRSALTRNGTAAMKESRVHDILSSMEALRSRKMDFQDFCAAAISVPQLEGRDEWEQQAQNAYQEFETDGSNRTVAVEDLARELRVPPTVPAHVVLHDWVRQSDGKLSFLGFTNLLRGVAPRSMLRPQ